MRISILFWNLKQLPLQEHVANLAFEHKAHLVLLVESVIDPTVMLAEFVKMGMSDFHFPPNPTGNNGDIHAFTRILNSSLEFVYEDPNNHISIRRLRIKKTPEMLLVILHSQSKRNWSEADQVQGAIRLARKVSKVEKQHGHRRTIVVGDLNMNPFESGIVGSEGFHAVMTKLIAADGFRIVDSEERHFFYNPMWRFFGEHPPAPSGTHYYSAGGKPIAFFWNIFDQVFLRPDLMDKLVDIKILHRVGSVSLLNSEGRPDTSVGSDHLPILFTLELKKVRNP